MIYMSVKDVRDEFAKLLLNQQYINVNREASMTSIVGSKTIELVSRTFIADQDSIFGDVNQAYVQREEQWYKSLSLNVNDIPGGAPEVWKAIADSQGYINSNYGWCVFSQDNNNQYDHVLSELKKNPESRRAIMIYTRPQMWNDYNHDGRNDFMCTNSVQYLVRDGAVHAIVMMRSNDSHIGYKNDYAWQRHVLIQVANDLNVSCGEIFWTAGSLHVYQRDFYLVDHYSKTGDHKITKKRYAELYPNSKYLNNGENK